MSVQYNKRWYEFVIGYRIGTQIYWVEGTNPGNALINYCRNAGISGAKMEAICSLCLESAIDLANEWLTGRICVIHELGDVIYGSPNGVIEEIKSE